MNALLIVPQVELMARINIAFESVMLMCKPRLSRRLGPAGIIVISESIPL